MWRKIVLPHTRIKQFRKWRTTYVLYVNFKIAILLLFSILFQKFPLLKQSFEYIIVLKTHFYLYKKKSIYFLTFSIHTQNPSSIRPKTNKNQKIHLPIKTSHRSKLTDPKSRLLFKKKLKKKTPKTIQDRPKRIPHFSLIKPTRPLGPASVNKFVEIIISSFITTARGGAGDERCSNFPGKQDPGNDLDSGPFWSEGPGPPGTRALCCCAVVDNPLHVSGIPSLQRGRNACD